MCTPGIPRDVWDSRVVFTVVDSGLRSWVGFSPQARSRCCSVANAGLQVPVPVLFRCVTAAIPRVVRKTLLLLLLFLWLQ